MPKIDDIIKHAILEAAKAKGSQAKVAQEAGITPTALNRYLSGKIASINASTWNMLFPIISAYLPDEYQRKFLDWKTPEEWREYSRQYPEAYDHFSKTVEELDIKKIAITDPRFGRTEERLKLFALIQEKLPYGYLLTLNKILRLLMDDEDKTRNFSYLSEKSEVNNKITTNNKD